VLTRAVLCCRCVTYVPGRTLMLDW
jgi:hypothetical protein